MNSQLEKPGGNSLAPHLRPLFSQLTQTLVENNFSPERILPGQRELLALIDSYCSSSQDIWEILEETERYVRWERLTGYWLSFILQLYFSLEIPDKGPQHHLYFIPSALLYAQAQIGLNRDLALSSLENAYHKSFRLVQNLEGPSPFLEILEGFKNTLQIIYEFYRRWYSPIPFTKVNPLSQHLYSKITFSQLRQNLPNTIKKFTETKEENYTKALEECHHPGDTYLRVVTRKFLGLHYENLGNWEAAAECYKAAFQEASTSGLEAEMAHLLRLRGHALRRLGLLSESIDQLQEAAALEDHDLLSYWRALTKRELGNSHLVIGDAQQALKHYRAGRRAFERHMANSFVPIAMGVSQQMFRSYTSKAISCALFMKNNREVLAEWESSGPNLVTDMVAETRYAHSLAGGNFPEFLRGRGVYYRFLGFLKGKDSPEDGFPQYLESLIPNYQDRKAYLVLRSRLAHALSTVHSSDQTISQLLPLLGEENLLLLFHPEEESTWVFLLQGGLHEIHHTVLKAGNRTLIPLYRAFQQKMEAASDTPDPSLFAQKALDEFLSACEAFLAPLEEFIPLMQGKKVKVFPRMVLNQIPFHAVKIGGRYMIDICPISHGLTLSILPLIQESPPLQRRLLVVHDEKGAPLYQGGLKALKESWGEDLLWLKNPSFDQLLHSVQQMKPTDLLFACHGKYDQEDPAASYLKLGRGMRISFEEFFSRLYFENHPCVALGACESGIGRSIVSAEFIGLPVALLASGAREVVGTLWQVNQMAASILFHGFYSTLKETFNPAEALNTAQKRLRDLTREELLQWLERYLPSRAKVYAPLIEKMGERPFSHPYYWAGFYVTGGL